MISTVYQHVAFMEEHYSEKTAFQYYDEKTKQIQIITFAQYVQDIRRFAVYLKGRLPRTGEVHVGILARNSYHYAVGLMGTMLAGSVVIPLNYEDTWENIQYQIDFADVDYLFHDGGYSEREPELVKRYGSMLHSLNEYADSGVSGNPDSEAGASNGVNSDTGAVICSSEGNRNEPESKNRRISEGEHGQENMAMLLFTSSTTGRSKGVMLSERNLYAPMKYFMDAALKMQTDGTEKYFQIVPMYHVSGVTTLLTWNALGVTINICQQIRYLYRDLKLMPSSMTSAVPMVLMSFYKDIKRGRIERLGGLKSIICVAAAVDSEVFQTFREHGITVSQGYGMTEIYGSGTNNASQDPAKDGSVGRPGAGCQLKIDQGEICLKSDSMMLGYYKNPEATAQVIRNGWLYTGDLGYVDEDGYLYITGRKKNLIILSNGENVSPEELEALLLKKEEIRETVVREKGNKICAEIFCEDEYREDIRQYISKINRELPHFKRITHVEFRDEAFPRTPNGKMKRI